MHIDLLLFDQVAFFEVVDGVDESLADAFASLLHELHERPYQPSYD